MRKQSSLESVECVGVGSPNPFGEETMPLRLGAYQRITDTLHINTNTL